jgi:hypothetical protein
MVALRDNGPPFSSHGLASRYDLDLVDADVRCFDDSNCPVRGHKHVVESARRPNDTVQFSPRPRERVPRLLFER